jgi:hypothetical protein
MQVLSLIWGILALMGMLIAFMPLFVALNWINIPLRGTNEGRSCNHTRASFNRRL